MTSGVKKITSVSNLEKVRKAAKARLTLRLGTQKGKGSAGTRRYVGICMGGGCMASGALDVKKAFARELRKRKAENRAVVFETGCLGPCALGPVIAVYPEGVLYERVTAADVSEIVTSHLKAGKVVERLLHKNAATGAPVPALADIPFLAKQMKIVLRNCGLIDPLDIEEYIARDGYAALARVLRDSSPEAVIDLLKRSGLRGRGGAGFPTWLKWSLTRKAAGSEKFVLCNGDEGDPGAFMDRSVLEGDPHSVIEAMCIAAHAIGASKGFVYVRAEYPLAVERLGKAIEDARQRGLLGENILGMGLSFDLEIRMGSGAFVCGEETALMTSIEGHRGEPRPRPPFPANKGLWGKPSALNNVETYAAIPAIVLNGAEWYAAYGTEKSKGTKVFALAGAVNVTGLVEIPIGTPLGDIIYDIGGGIPDGKAFKAAQIGGPSGGCIPKEHLNVPVDYESLTELGAIMGSGGLIVMDEDTCMVDVARYFLDFVQDESCGKCVPCRVGTKRMLEILERICAGKGEEGDIERLEVLGRQIKDTALCGLGQTAPNPVLSTIRHFRDEYVAHIRDKRCPAGVCPALVRAPCQNACPAGVNVPGFVSLLAEKRYPEALRLHRERNPFAAICASVCFHPCEQKCRRASLDEPLAIRAVKRFMVGTERKPTPAQSQPDPQNAKRRVAIVGAGPAGLSCAYFLARLGYRPTVFEAEKRVGGMLVQAIPAYRLPRDTLEREVRMIRDMGVEFRTGKKLGRDFTLKDLRRKGYQAVFLGVGAPRGIRLGIPGEDAKGVTDGIEFLHAYNIEGAARVGRRVAVIGGGNVAVDVARTAVRLGAEEVTVFYRRTREEMPAYEEEIREAAREGVKFEFLVAPREILAERGRVRALRLCRMALGAFDRSGRRRPEENCGDAYTVEVDQIVAAIGQGPDNGAWTNGLKLKVSERGWIQTDPVTRRTSADWIFAGGDAVSGPASVVEAIADGEKAAVGIDTFLSGASHAFWRREQEVDTAFDPNADPVPYGRAAVTNLPVQRRKLNFEEVEQAWNAKTALREAARCLRCDYREATE
ncbi:MAG: FAD-dependent oxidoreductase [Kiritimatiellae bacterium]|nr:FAD-dependent oxidoreductase [Kiritimatiellia bacterium]